MEINGNRNRIITINEKYLKTCSMLIEEEGTQYDESKIAIIHSIILADVIIQLANYPNAIRIFLIRLHQRNYLMKKVLFPEG